MLFASLRIQHLICLPEKNMVLFCHFEPDVREREIIPFYTYITTPVFNAPLLVITQK